MNQEFSKSIETTFPYPIAATFRRVRTIDPDDIIHIHDSYGDLFEIILKYLAVISLQGFKLNYQLPNYFEDFLKKMLHPSLGHWNEIIRMVSSEENLKCKLASRISSFYKAKLNADVKKECEIIQNTLGSKLNLKTFKDSFDLLILYRNKTKGHGAKISKEEYKTRLKAIEIIIQEILAELSFLKEWTLFYIEEINVLPTSEFRHKCKIFTGTLIEPKSLIKPNSLLPNHVYVEENSDQESILIDIYPLLSAYSCKECKSEQIFVFNDFRNDRLEYLSYTCGHFYYPEMLPGEFEKIFNVQLNKFVLDEDIEMVKDEDAKEKAWHYHALAMKKMANKEYYQALEYLQLAVSHDSTWESNYYSAILTMITEGSPSEVLFYLNNCDQIDPDNSHSSKLKNKLLNLFSSDEDFRNPAVEKLKIISKYALEILDEEVYIPHIKPIHYYLTPRKLRQNYNLLWIAVSIIYFFFSGIVSKSFGIELNYFVQTLKILIMISFLSIINYITVSISELYFSFMQLIPQKSKEKFQEWFHNQLNHTFGNFSDEKSLIKTLNLKDQNSRKYIRTFIILFLAALIGAIYLTCFDDFWSIKTIFTALDYFVMWIVVVLGVPVMINTFKMLRDFSQFPLKPVIDTLNLVSLQKIGKVIFYVSVPWAFDYFAFTLIGFLTFSNNVIVIQLLCFYFMVGIGCIWTLLTPYYLSKSLDNSKNRILSKYSEHLEIAFNRLLDNPNQENLERYHWLQRQQKEFVNIKTSPLSRSTIVGIALINLFIFSIAVLYPFLKFKISFEDVINWLKFTFIL